MARWKLRRAIAISEFLLTEEPGRDAVPVLGVLEDGVRDGEGVPDHGAVEAVLGHDGRLAPALFGLPPLGATVLKPHLKKSVKVSLAWIQIEFSSKEKVLHRHQYF